MDAFSYLSVLLSIIIGLAITQVLQGYRAMLLARHRVRPFAPTIIWSLLILVMATQSWWASFGLADRHDWSFGTFGVILLQTILLYMAAGLVLPDAGPDEVIDLRAHYFGHTGIFFGTQIAMLATSLLKNALLDGRNVNPLDIEMHGVFIAISTLALFVRGARAHLGVAIAATVFIALYVVLLFGHLRG